MLFFKMLFIFLLFVSYEQNIKVNDNQSINNYPFFDCYSSTIIISKHVKSISEYRFFNCKKLESVLFSNETSVINIENNVFSFCSNLESIKILRFVE